MLSGLTFHRVNGSHLTSMTTALRRSNTRARLHGAVLQPSERRDLERAGWRTTLEFRENHVRGLDGCLLRVEPVWIAEAERFDREIAVASAEGATPDEAWAKLRADIDASRVKVLRRVRIASGR
jgi:hypothetical protein